MFEAKVACFLSGAAFDFSRSTGSTTFCFIVSTLSKCAKSISTGGKWFARALFVLTSISSLESSSLTCSILSEIVLTMRLDFCFFGFFYFLDSFFCFFSFLGFISCMGGSGSGTSRGSMGYSGAGGFIRSLASKLAP